MAPTRDATTAYGVQIHKINPHILNFIQI